MHNANDSLYAFARHFTPNGTQTLSKMPDRFVEGYPKVISWAKDAFVTDVENKTFIDYIAALGPIILGYANNIVDQAVIDQIRKGVIYSMPSVLEGEVAAELSKLSPTGNMWKFTKTGSDACTAAVKIAKAYTNRDHIVVCGYHGWHDWFSIVNDKKAGITRVLNQFITKVRYNRIEDFEKAITQDTACVIMEPEIFESPIPGFLTAVKELCHKNGALLVFDETVTGFRYPGLLAQRYYNVYPDLTIIGKAMANGYPMAAVGGLRDVMLTCERDDFFISTTFGGDCVGLAASKAVLKEMPKYIDAMEIQGNRIKDLFNRELSGKAVCKGFPTRTMFEFPTTEHKALFWQEAANQGVIFGYSNFIMAAHLNQNVEEETFKAIKKAASVVLENWHDPKKALIGPSPKEVFRLLRS